MGNMDIDAAAISDSEESGRGLQTRRKLLRAGLELFGTRDFDDVTTRQLASRAAVNLAAIPYHFGTKENIYLAVAQRIVESVDSRTRGAISRMRAVCEEESPSADTLLQALRSFINAFAHEVLGVEDAAFRAGFILREQFRPSAAFDVLYQGFMDEMHSNLSLLFSVLLARSADGPAMAYRAQCLIGEILIFHMGREVLLRQLQAENLDAETVAAFVADKNISALRREIKVKE